MRDRSDALPSPCHFPAHPPSFSRLICFSLFLWFLKADAHTPEGFNVSLVGNTEKKKRRDRRKADTGLTVMCGCQGRQIRHPSASLLLWPGWSGTCWVVCVDREWTHVPSLFLHIPATHASRLARQACFTRLRAMIGRSRTIRGASWAKSTPSFYF